MPRPPLACAFALILAAVSGYFLRVSGMAAAMRSKASCCRLAGSVRTGTTAVVSFLPFTTAIAATHLFASNLSLHEVTVSSSAEHVATVLFGLNLTVAALMLYLMLRHAGRTPGIAANDLAEEELQAFATQRRSAMLLQASATIVGAFLPLLAVVFYLALAIFYIIDPVRLMRTHGRGRARIKGMSAEN